MSKIKVVFFMLIGALVFISYCAEGSGNLPLSSNLAVSALVLLFTGVGAYVGYQMYQAEKICQEISATSQALDNFSRNFHSLR